MARHVIAATDERIWLCDECEAVWLDGEAVTSVEFDTFANVMSNRGLSPLWLELRDE